MTLDEESLMTVLARLLRPMAVNYHTVFTKFLLTGSQRFMPFVGGV
jgi:hypothetical protein